MALVSLDPVFVCGLFKLFAWSLANDLAKPSVKWPVWQERLEGFDDFFSPVLHIIDLERAMIEAIDAILQNPFAFGLGKQFLQVGKSFFDALKQLSNVFFLVLDQPSHLLSHLFGKSLCVLRRAA